MKILFMARHFGCLRNYERAIFRLAERGHRLHLVAQTDDILNGLPMVTRWASEQPAITCERLPDIEEDPSAEFKRRLRLMGDYLRYLEPAYAGTPKLEERARLRTPRPVLTLASLPGGRSRLVRHAAGALIRAAERAVPRPGYIDAYIRSQRPDVALFTPLVGLGSEEQDYLDAAVSMGVRSIFCVWSWDNLSSKALLRTIPDAVTVWNETQQREAVDLHAVPPSRVIVTGAQSFDQWFGRTPTRSRETFCARVGLPADRPFLLWVCSSLLKGSQPEAPFVVRWLQAIRASSEPALQGLPVLIRPHPSRQKEWREVDLGVLGPVSLWGANPIDAEAKADYFESLHYSAAVVGLNTSAFLEAAIVGRPVYTVLLPEMYENQEGTLHFHYLLNLEGGLLHAARDMAAHLADLARAVQEPEASAARSVRFVKRFIRPAGLDVESTGRFVEAVERVATGPARAARLQSPFAVPFRRLMVSVSQRAALPESRVRRWLLSPREAVVDEKRSARIAADRAARAARVAEREEAMRQHRLRKEQARIEWLARKAQQSQNRSVAGRAAAWLLRYHPGRVAVRVFRRARFWAGTTKNKLRLALGRRS